MITRALLHPAPLLLALATPFIASATNTPSTQPKVRPAPVAPRPVTPPVSPELPKRRPGWLGITGEAAVAVREVDPNGPAKRAGLKEGDVIVGVDGHPLEGPDTLLDRLRELGPGGELPLIVMRDGKDLELTVRLGHFPPERWNERTEAPRYPEPPTPPRLATAPDDELVIEVVDRVKRAFLGLQAQDLGHELAEYFGLDEGEGGVLVEHVFPNEGAAAAGIQAGDVLQAIDGRAIPDLTSLGELLRDLEPERVVVVKLRRKGKMHQKTVKLGSRDTVVYGVPGLPSSPEEVDASVAELSRLLALARENDADGEIVSELRRTLERLRQVQSTTGDASTTTRPSAPRP
ncbi:MAG: PDZ domain-containing protein [Acidobacteriota bacterium]